jgi:hypothetical protein
LAFALVQQIPKKFKVIKQGGILGMQGDPIGNLGCVLVINFIVDPVYGLAPLS